MNVEIKQLSTWIYDEVSQLDNAIQDCLPDNPLLAQALRTFSKKRKRTNQNLTRVLNVIYTLPEYSGEKSVGERLDETMVQSRQATTVLLDMEHAVEIDACTSSDEDDHELIDEVFEGVSRLALHE